MVIKQFSSVFAIIILSIMLASCISERSEIDKSKFEFAEDNSGIILPEGFQAVVVAEEVVDSIGGARHLTIDEDGDIYIALRRTEGRPGIVALQDTSGNGVADRIERFSDYTGTGIGLYNNYLYFSTDTSIIRYSMEGVDLVPSSEAEVVVSGFPEQSGHASKPFTIDGEGYLYVNVGAPSNACQENSRTPKSPGMDPCPDLELQDGIWQFDADKLGQTQRNDGHRYATGIRNSFPEWNHTQNQLYAVQHGRDQLHSLWPDLYTIEQNAELPAEEMFKVNEGDNFGWPYCYYDQIQEEKVLAPEYGGDGEKIGRCSEFEDPIISLPGHWAPNGLKFYTGSQFPAKYRDGAFIAFHGSWNRAPLPQEGYRGVFVPFDGDQPANDNYETFADGFAGKDTLRSPGDAEYRPMGLAEGPDGTLYISETETGKIWRVVFTGN